MIEDLRQVDVDKPWFLYLAPGACHSPHHAPPDWIERYRGRFDRGWDEWRDEALARQKAMDLLPEHAELSPRPDWVPAWADLGPAERRVYARYMEAFAGYLSHADHEIGRLLDRLTAMGELDEIGGPRIHNNYPWGWTVAGNTPFRRWKRETHEGGVADPLIVHWPNGVTARGEVRHQYVHAID